MTSSELREMVASLRVEATAANDAHVAAVHRLCADALTAEERAALEQVASVRDCMARKHAQWAAVLEAAALDLEG